MIIIWIKLERVSAINTPPITAKESSCLVKIATEAKIFWIVGFMLGMGAIYYGVWL